MASPGNGHCANCIGTRSFHIQPHALKGSFKGRDVVRPFFLSDNGSVLQRQYHMNRRTAASNVHTKCRSISEMNDSTQFKPHFAGRLSQSVRCKELIVVED